MNVIIYNNLTSQHKFQEILSWCNQYFGPGPKVYNNISAELYQWCYDNSLGTIKIIYIKDDRDYMLFQLRWANI